MILAIVGPTAVGKTRLSIALAKIYNGEIINCDSMQIYRGLDIGTAKATLKEQDGVKHHLLSIKNIDEDYSVYDYQKDARSCVEEIKSRGHVPIFVGGTGLYLKAALYDYDFTLEEETSDYSALSNDELYAKIQSYETGIVVDSHNRRRLERLLFKLEQGWIPKDTDFHLLYPDTIFLGLTTDRNVLYEKINQRFDEMLIPLIDEVKPLILSGVSSKALQTGIGYKEFYDFFSNKKTLQEVVEEIKKNSRNYAKRQYTWFLNQMNISWFSVDYENFSNTIQEIVTYLDSFSNKL